jgi:hypothetical protein
MPKRSRKVQQKDSAKRVFHTKQKPKPRHISKAHLQERDENQTAFDAVQRIIAQTEATLEGKNPAAVALGRLGGLKGGYARAAKMTDKERSKSASDAAKARWTDRKGEK